MDNKPHLFLVAFVLVGPRTALASTLAEAQNPNKSRLPNILLIITDPVRLTRQD